MNWFWGIWLRKSLKRSVGLSRWHGPIELPTSHKILGVAPLKLQLSKLIDSGKQIVCMGRLNLLSPNLALFLSKAYPLIWILAIIVEKFEKFLKLVGHNVSQVRPWKFGMIWVCWSNRISEVFFGYLRSNVVKWLAHNWYCSYACYDYGHEIVAQGKWEIKKPDKTCIIGCCTHKHNNNWKWEWISEKFINE